MSKMPGSTQKRYRGRLRSQLWSALNHIERAIAYDTKWQANPCSAYPQQLSSPADVAALSEAANTLSVMLAKLGPIPNRPSCPVS